MTDEGETALLPDVSPSCETVDSRTTTPTLDRNPEPPKELLEGHLIDADNIGDTVFSKHWMFTTLMNLIQAVDGETEKKEAIVVSDSGLDLDDNLQDELCRLWDMSMNPEVVNFLMEFKAVDIFTGVVAKSKSPRATEICVGLLGNMACDDKACEAISESDKLRELMLLLLESPDAPTLVETTRLLYTCVSKPGASSKWLQSIKTSADLFTNVTFILQSSTNNDLLRNTAEFVDKVLDLDEEICQHWSTEPFVQAILEAVSQNEHEDVLSIFIHNIQLLSTCERGVEALSPHAEQLCHVIVSHLKQICSDEIVGLEGRAHAIGSALSVLHVTFNAWTDSTCLLIDDFHLVRCLLKILHVVYPQLHQVDKQHLESRRMSYRSFSKSSGEGDGVIDVPQPEHSSLTHTISDDHKERHRLGSPGKTDTGGGDANREENKDEVDEEVKDEKEKRKILTVLYEILQSLIEQVVFAMLKAHLKEVATTSEDASEQSPPSPRSESRDLTQEESSENGGRRIRFKTLDYLDSMCERERIQYMLYTLDQSVANGQHFRAGISGMAQRCSLERLGRIVKETPSRTPRPKGGHQDS